ncbi:MAG: hypothetical protein M0D54_06480 [Hyphomonadaceae bacterium JAD_PAG50586_4]|nr:MAG: hypothetical protein M0D54_06480 [Hyphomonadaceae bacterium JAD_PAG50586_4]
MTAEPRTAFPRSAKGLGVDDAAFAPARPAGPLQRVRAFIDSLAGRLLALTVLAVVAGEIFVFAPALAGFHESWLRERVSLAQIAALALEVTPEYEIADLARVRIVDERRRAARGDATRR